jgi:hypothetical protein
MAVLNSWLKGTREAILAMAIVWIAVCAEKRTLWGIAGVALTEFAALKDAAAAALALVKDKSTRAKRRCLLAWSLAA